MMVMATVVGSGQIDIPVLVTITSTRVSCMCRLLQEVHGLKRMRLKLSSRKGTHLMQGALDERKEMV